MRSRFCIFRRAVRRFSVTAVLVVAFGTVALAVILPLFRSSAAPRQIQSRNKFRSAPDFVPGEILVRFREDAAKSKDSELRITTNGRQVNVHFERLLPRELVSGVRLARVPAQDTLAVIEQLRARPDVLYAEPNYILRKTTLPNDPRFNEQWGLQSTSNPNADIDAPQAWDTTTGSSNVVVGVIDEGIDISHPDLAANIWTNPGETAGNNVDDDGNGFVDDIHGWDFANNDNTVYDGPGTTPEGDPIDAHGTHVAGVIGAVGNNGVGISGVNWQVRMLPMKFLGPNGGTTANVLRAYDYARSLLQAWQTSGGTRGANIRVLNNSYGGRGQSQLALDAIRALSDAGILFVASAGNESRDNDRFPVYPASYNVPNVVSVGAIDSSGLPASGFSNYGVRSVDLVAPGSQILSTTPNDTYTEATGTSASAPHATGTAALICAAFPTQNLRRLRAALVYGGAPGFIQFTSSGKRINARTSLENAAEVDATPPAAASNFQATPQGYQRYNLQWTAPGDDGSGNGKVAIYEVRYSDSDLSSPAVFEQSARLLAPAPASPGTNQATNVVVPFRHTGGFIGVRAVDNVGNVGPIVTTSLAPDIAEADPYLVTTGAIETLSTGGTPLNLHADDQYLSYQLPFDFTYFGTTSRGVTISTNGAIHFGFPSQLGNGQPDVDVNSPADLSGRKLIAGLWDDLRTDKRAGDDVYVVTPDLTRIIFRWQAVTFDTEVTPGNFRGENPVNFEIELKIDGTIIVRYGDGNQNLLPIVGASAGEPDPYVVDSHTSSFALKSLASAPAVTFTPRRPAPLPTLDLALGLIATPSDPASGQQLTYLLEASHSNLNQSSFQTVITNQLPAGTTFVSCTTSRGTCVGPAVGSTGTVTVQVGTLVPGFTSVQVTIVVQVTATAGATLTNTASVSGFWPDPNPANNSVTHVAQVRAPALFNNVIAISAGSGFDGPSGHSLALKSDGRVWAWGSDLFYQLGDGYANQTIASPVLTPGLSNVTAISAGGDHSLALKSNGTVWAWGSNTSGQSGSQDQFNSSKTRPTQVSGLNGSFIAVAAGGGHSLALRSDGTVWAWGYNGTGALGDGTTSGTPVYTPVQTTGLTNVVAIAAGSGFSLAVKADGTVWGWGSNTNGVLGLPTSTFSSTTPVQVAGITNVQKISAGGRHALALKSDGTVWSWGDNSQGQLGSGEAAGSFPTPRQASGLSGVTDLDAGFTHSLAVKSNGTVWSWGSNTDGQLGIGNNTNSNVPVAVNLPSATAVSGGGNTSAVLLADGTIRMFGRNDNGQLGDRTRVTRSQPVEVSASFGPPIPFFNPDGGTFNNPIGVTMSSQIGAIIYYTTDGSDPNESSPAVSHFDTILIDHSLTLKAIAFKPGWPASPMKIASYVITGPGPTPTPTPGGSFSGQEIAFTRPANGLDVFLMNLDGTNATNISNAAGDDRYPSWAPDGTKLSFTTTRPDNLQHIAVSQLDGTSPVVINHANGMHESWPSWSRDGTRMAYITTSPFTNVSWVSVMDTNGAPLGQSQALGVVQSPTWSADGSKIAVAIAANSFQQFDIWVLPSNILFASPLNLTNSSANDVDPAWSPDGTKIAFATDRDGNYEIYLMNSDGTNLQRLTNSAGADRSPSWSGDGSRIVFTSQRDGNEEIYVMNADGSNPIRLTNNSVADSNPSWRQAAPAIVQFSSNTFTASEGATSAVVTVARTGNVNSTVSVNYATVDNDAEVRCDDQVNNHGAAYARCDYATSIDTLKFAPGETSKTIAIPLVDDRHVEGPETVQLILNGAQGGIIGGQSTATLTITDNDSAGSTNPIDSSPFFVRQHYLDFLSREPEQDGFDAWLRVLNNCSDVNNNPDCDRLTVSSSFFRSLEFQLKGYFVFKFYRLTLNRIPTYVEISADMRKVTGQTADEVFTKRDNFANAWGTRQDFLDRFAKLNDGDFLDRLLRNAGLDDLTGSVTRQSLLADLTTNRKTRTQVVRAFIEHPDVDAAEYNRAFVAMQYYGYLRRTPEPGGFNNWLNYLNAHPTDFRTMVNGFVNSIEYRLRFGP